MLFILFKKIKYVSSIHTKSKKACGELLAIQYSKTLTEILLINQLHDQVHGKYYNLHLKDMHDKIT